MNGGKIVILHITFDGILFEQVYPKFEAMEGYENRYLLHTFGSPKEFRFIKNSEKIICADSLESWGKIIEDSSVDIIYLHGLWYSYFKVFDYIRPGVLVMWWCYGMEIYENSLRWPPLLPLKIYKPKTYWFYLINMMSLHLLAKELSRATPKLYVFLLKAFNLVRGKRVNDLEHVLSRIDYAFTPLEIELENLKKRYPYIKAQPFRLKKNIEKNDVPIHNSAGGILFEHSANLTNNHLDIIDIIKKKKIDLTNRDIFIPLSYGEKKVAQRVCKESKNIDTNVHCLTEPIPYDEYSEMISSCTHAFFGMIRQSGLGNIYICFRKGIKIFFFKNSILYKYFKMQGFYVYSFEDDLNNSSILEPLSPDQANFNSERFYSLYVSQSTYKEQFDNILQGFLKN